MLAEAAFPAAQRPHCFVCGLTAGLVEAAALALVELGHAPGSRQDRALRPDGRIMSEDAQYATATRPAAC